MDSFNCIKFARTAKMLIRLLVFLLVFLPQWAVIAQPVLTAVSGNRTLQVFHENNPAFQWNAQQKLLKKSASDTLQLPFREDFSTSKLFPDTARWMNNYVYVNGDFGINPPTYGVATFDYLDPFGHPYTPLGSGSAPGDSLTSKPINLTVYQGNPLGPGDSVYLSFYVQPQGRGEAPDASDILYLEFKNEFNVWERVWEQKGSALTPFQQVIIPIDSSRFFHPGFQFQFINYTRQSGNLNHWHLDYIFIDKDRRMAVTHYDDYAVQTQPTSLLKNWASMPWHHFQAASSSEAADSVFFNVSNLNNATLNIEVRYSESNEGNVLNATQFSANAANVPPAGWERRRFRSYDFSGLSGKKVIIDRRYELREPSVINRYTDNDAIETEQVFDNYFAYDDGTAEGGFGWDSDVPFPGGTGRIAVKYRLNVPDTIWAIGMFFNQSRIDVSRQSFTLKVWKSITIGGNARDDIEYASYAITAPVYTNERNGYYLFKLDTPLVLPSGDFYIGWTQQGTFNLNVGWDMNYGYVANKEGKNPGIYYNILGDWRPWDVSGAPMIRPYIGSEPLIASVANPTVSRCSVYPQPVKEWLTIEGMETEFDYSIYSLEGREVQGGKADGNKINFSRLGNGIYVLQCLGSEGTFQRFKIIKSDE